MSSRSTNNEVLVIIGVGGMGVSVARRSGAGRTIVLADINAEGLNAAAGALTEDGHQVLTRRGRRHLAQFGGRGGRDGPGGRPSHGGGAHRGAFAATGIR